MVRKSTKIQTEGNGRTRLKSRKDATAKFVFNFCLGMSHQCTGCHGRIVKRCLGKLRRLLTSTQRPYNELSDSNLN